MDGVGRLYGFHRVTNTSNVVLSVCTDHLTTQEQLLNGELDAFMCSCYSIHDKHA